MSHPDVKDTINSFMADNWDLSAWETINGPMAETPGQGEAFVVVQYPFSVSERIAVNERVYREEGGVRFVFHVIRGVGDDLIEQMTRKVFDLFTDRKIGEVNCGVPDSPFFDDSNDEGLYFKAAMVVPYWFTYRNEE